ncbi:MAG: ATP-binding protein [Bryobacteraceae bacterium]
MMRKDTPYDVVQNSLSPLSFGSYFALPWKAFARNAVGWRGELLAAGRWRPVLISAAIVALTTIAGFWIAPVIGTSTLAVLYMLAVMFSALCWGLHAAVLSAVASALSLDVFFVAPHRSFVAGDIWNLIAATGLVTIGLVISTFIVTAREDAERARRREASTAALSSFTQSLAAGNELDQIMETVTRHFRAAFQLPMVVWLPESDRLAERFRSADLLVDEADHEKAHWVLRNEKEATRVHGSGLGTCYRPLKTGGAVVGVIGFRTRIPDSSLSGENELLNIFLNQTALAITRAELSRNAKRAEVLQETDKLQRALLSSISHDLRSPLASVLGVLNTILDDGPLLNQPTQQILLETAREEAVRLDCLVRNLLDMTRLEGGVLRVKTELCDLHDIVTAALYQLGAAASGRRVSVIIPPDLPLVPMDDVLIVQVLVNLLDNALKYGGKDGSIQLDARLEGEELEVRVLDSGCGIPERDLERVFEKFFRAVPPGAPKGAGLGLSICKGFVEVHNGRILAARRSEGGTELSFFLPLEGKA